MRRHANSGLEVSTFPFLSILFALIGILTLVMVGLMATRDMGAAVPGPDPEELCADLRSYESYETQIDVLTRQLLAYQAEYRELVKLKDEAEVVVQAKEDELAAAPTAGVAIEGPIGVGIKVCMVPDPGDTYQSPKIPIAVEVMLGSFIVHSQASGRETERKYPAIDLDRDESPMSKFLADLDRQHDRQYLLLLLHEDGPPTFRKLRGYLIKHFPAAKKSGAEPSSRIEMGYEPFSRQWRYAASANSKEK